MQWAATFSVPANGCELFKTVCKAISKGIIPFIFIHKITKL